MNLPFSEARDRLQNRIKQDNIELKTLDRECLETKRMVETYNTNIKEIDADLRGGGQTQGQDEQKYEILYQKEKEINEFTEQFEKEKVDHEKNIKENQEIIAQLLEHM